MFRLKKPYAIFSLILIGIAVWAQVFRATPSHALETAWDSNDFVSVRLISAVEAVGDLEVIPLGLEFAMKKGWKIYWRNPGDAGYPPKPDWTGAENLKASEILWPLPTRFSILGLQSLGYEDHVVLPLNATLEETGKALHLKGEINYLTCEEICIPFTAALDLTVPSGVATPAKTAFIINKYSSKVPLNVDFKAPNPVGLNITETALEHVNGDNKLSIRVESREELNALDLFIEGPVGSFFEAATITYAADKKSALMTALGGGFDEEMRQIEPVTFTVAATDKSIETSTLVSADTGWMEEYLAGNSAGLSAKIILIALLGGLILNLMPCVLPVLSLKMLSMINHGESSAGKIRASLLATTLGILFSFLLLASVLVGLKAGGVAIGWGIQFQQPIFLIFMLFVLMGFATNLSGLLEIRLPGQLATAAAKASQGNSLQGHFLTGMFASLLATPCSAPFLGTAVGFALSQGGVEIFTIFMALGIGLAAPYILFMFVPNMAGKLPKPGKWMDWVKLVLASALVLTAVWLVTVLQTSIGPLPAWTGFALSCLMLLILYLRKKGQARLYRPYTFAALLPILAGFAIPHILPAPPTPAPTVTTSDIDWVAFDVQKIDNLVREGKNVFVDVTADWCITCKYNKFSTLSDAKIRDWLEKENVVAMQADWTLPNDEILQYLQTYGRYGIPFNIIYRPQKPEGLVLPELLTPGIMLEKLHQSETRASN